MRHRMQVLGLAIAGGATTLTVLLILLLLLLRRRLKTSKKTSPCDEAALRRFSYRELKTATRGFGEAHKLGQGGFGSVFKGILRNGVEVAVKRLDTASLQGEREFQNELSVMGDVQLHHRRKSSLASSPSNASMNFPPHVVGLLGFCAGGSRRKRKLLVYEFMENRSLQEALFDEKYAVRLDWGKRFKIITDVAKALAFLHHEFDPPIIHGDVKPSNVLLDPHFNARLADFGLARVKNAGDGITVAAEYHSMELHNVRKERRRAAAAAAVAAEEQTEIIKGGVNREVTAAMKSSDEEDPTSPIAAKESSASLSSPSPSSLVMLQSSEVIDDAVSQSAYEETEADTWSKISPSELDCRSEISLESGSKEFNFLDRRSWHRSKKNSSSSSAQHQQQQQKDWWWKQDSSNMGCEFSIKDYIVDWVGRSKSHDQEQQQQQQQQQQSSQKKKKKNMRSGSLEWWADCDDHSSKAELARRIKQVAKQRSKQQQLQQLQSRENSREWWRDDGGGGGGGGDLSGELDSKSKKSEESFSFYYSGELHHHSHQHQHQKSNQNQNQNQNIPSSEDDAGRRRVRTRSREWWSGEMQRGREWWSGELGVVKGGSNRSRRMMSGELRSNHTRGDRSRSRSREWWSGELMMSKATTVSSTPSMRGTVCYVAPEYGGGGAMTEKGDVYSFGVLLLVVVSGRRPLQVLASPLSEFERANLIAWARQASQAGRAVDLVDPTVMSGVGFSKEEALLCISVALLCLQRLPAVRPNMSDVVKILCGECDLPTLPFEFSPSPSSAFNSSSSKRKHQASIDHVTVDIPH